MKPVPKPRYKISSLYLNKDDISIGEGQNTSTVETQFAGNDQAETAVKPVPKPRYTKIFEGESSTG